MSAELKALIARVRDEAEYVGETDPLIFRDIVLEMCALVENEAAS